MNQMLKILQLAGLLGFVGGLSACSSAPLPPVREGDVIFQSTPSRQTRALEVATGSRYTHVGLVMRENREWVVYEAIQPVVTTPLDAWIRRGTGRHFVLKRWIDAGRLDKPALARLRDAVKAMLGRDYDGRFLWGDDQIYCSELVWKAYQQGLGVELTATARYRDFNLAHPEVRALLLERFSNPVPLDEPVVPPSALFDSPALVEVARGGKEFQ